MAMQQDSTNGNGPKDFSVIVKLAFAYQDGKMSTFQLLSHGTIGKYWYDVFNAPDGKIWRDGKSTKTPVRFFVQALSEQEEFEGQLTGQVTGRHVDQSGKKAIKLDTYAQELGALDTLLNQWSGDSPTQYGFWVRQWILAQAFDTGFLNQRFYDLLADASNEVKTHALKNWKLDNPAGLRKSWQAAWQAKSETVTKAVEPVVKAVARPASTVNGNAPKTETVAKVAIPAKTKPMTKNQLVSEIKRLQDRGAKVSYGPKDKNADLEAVLDDAQKQVLAKAFNGKKA